MYYFIVNKTVYYKINCLNGNKETFIFSVGLLVTCIRGPPRLTKHETLADEFVQAVKTFLQLQF